MKWVALRSRFHVLGLVSKSDKSNAWLEARVSWGSSSVVAIEPFEKWEERQKAQQALAESKQLRAERKAQKERDRLDPPIPDDVRGALEVFALGYGTDGSQVQTSSSERLSRA